MSNLIPSATLIPLLPHNTTNTFTVSGNDSMAVFGTVTRNQMCCSHWVRGTGLVSEAMHSGFGITLRELCEPVSCFVGWLRFFTCGSAALSAVGSRRKQEWGGSVIMSCSILQRGKHDCIFLKIF